MHYWGAFGGVPQWVFALAALTIVGTMNMIGVKWFAEMEFWFALIKVLAIVTFLVVGTVFLGSGQPLDGNTTGFHLITDNGGFFPHGLLPALVLIQGVVSVSYTHLNHHYQVFDHGDHLVSVNLFSTFLKLSPILSC